MFFFYILLILVVAIVAERIVVKKYNIEKRRPFKIYKPVNKIHQRIEVSLFLIFIIGLFIVGFGFQMRIEAYYSIGFLSALFAVRAYMERTYEKESKRYMISTLTSGFSFLAFWIFMFYLSPQQIDVSHEGFMYSEDDSTSEQIEIEVSGELRPNLFATESITGEITINKREFFLTNVDSSVGESGPVATFAEELDEHYFNFFEIDGSQRGEMWSSSDFTQVAGRVNGIYLESPLLFVAPASTIEERNELIRKMEEE